QKPASNTESLAGLASSQRPGLVEEPCADGLLLELGSLLGAFGGVARGVGMGADAGKLALVHDEILGADRFAGEIFLKDLAGTGGVARLRRQRAARNMRRHAVVRHGAPRMVLRCRLRGPDDARLDRGPSPLH